MVMGDRNLNFPLIKIILLAILTFTYVSPFIYGETNPETVQKSDPNSAFLLKTRTVNSSMPTAVNFGDINNDGTLEIISVTKTQGLLHISDEKYNKIIVTDITQNKNREYNIDGDVSGCPAIGKVINDDDMLDIVVAGVNGKVCAFDSSTGKVAWVYSTGGKIVASPVLVDVNNDKLMDVVIGSDDEYVHVIDGKTGLSIQKCKLKGKILSTAAVGDVDSDGVLDLIVADNFGFVYKLNTEKWEFSWAFTIESNATYSPNIVDIDNNGVTDVLITDQNNIYAIEGINGKQLWKRPLPGSVIAIADVNDDGALEVIANIQGKFLYALDGKNGEELWKYPMDATPGGQPMVADIDQKVAILVGGSNCIHIIDGKTGSLIRSDAITQGRVICSGALDIDGDGALDIAASVSNSDLLHVLFTSYKGISCWAKMYGNCYNNSVQNLSLTYAKLVDLKASDESKITKELDRDQDIPLKLRVINNGIVMTKDVTLSLNSEDVLIPQEYKDGKSLGILRQNEDQEIDISVSIPSGIMKDVVTVEAKAEDSVGHKSNFLLIQLKLTDIQPPEIVIEYPEDNMQTISKEEHITGFVTDNRGVASVTVEIEGSETKQNIKADQSSKFSLDTIVPLILGDNANFAHNIILVTASDTSGNSSDKKVNIDSGFPSLEISYKVPEGQFNPGAEVPTEICISNKGIVTAKAVALSIASSDSDVYQMIDSGDIPAGSNKIENILLTIPENARSDSFEFKATAAESETKLVVEYPIRLLLNDIEPPEIFIESPFDGADTKLDTVSVKGRVTDNISVASVSFKVNSEDIPDKAIVLNPTMLSIDIDQILPLKLGENTFTIIATDGSGKKTEITIKLTRILPKPDLVITQYRAVSNGVETKEIKAGDTIELNLVIQNNGTGGSNDINVNLSVIMPENKQDSDTKGMKLSSEAIIPKSSTLLEDIQPGSSKECSFTVQIPQSYEGEKISFRVELSNQLGYNTTLTRTSESKDIELYLNPQESSVSKKWALLIGIDKYKDVAINPLKYTVTDVEGLKKSLTNPSHGGFNADNVKMFTNEEATRAKILASLWDLSTADTNDTILIYFSGHGAEDGKQSYLLTYETDLEHIPVSSISSRDFAEALSAVKAEKIIIILDCCHSGGLPTTGKDVASKLPSANFYKELLEATGKITFTSCRVGQKSFEFDEKKHGVFTFYIIEGLNGKADENKDTYVTFDELKGYVLDKVKAWAKQNGKSQTPEVNMAHVTGDIALVNISELIMGKVLALYKSGKFSQSIANYATELLEKNMKGDVLSDMEQEGLKMLVDIYNGLNPNLFKQWIEDNPIPK